MFALDALLLLLPLFGDSAETAFNSIIGVTVIGFQVRAARIAFAAPMHAGVAGFPTQDAGVAPPSGNSMR